MSVTKLSISLDPELEQAIRAAAGEASVSSWVAEAARRQLRQQAGGHVRADFQLAQTGGVCGSNPSEFVWGGENGLNALQAVAQADFTQNGA